MRNREAAAQPSHESSPRYELRDRRINAIKTGEGTMKKRWIYASVTALFLGMMTGCAQQTQTETQHAAEKDGDTPAWKTYAKEDPVTLDWYVNYSWFDMGWGKNLVSQKITDETGVSVNFITPLGNEDEKLNALIASDSLPDLITLGWWEPQVNEMIQKNLVYALNDLADQYDMYFYKVADPAVVDWYSDEKGNIYGYPNSSYTPKDVEERDDIASNQTFLVRKDIYEAIGSPDMTTQEGFEAAVKKEVEMFPEVDGKPLIPIGAHVFDGSGCVSFGKYLQNFLAIPWEKDGKLYDGYTDPEYLSWLKFFRKLGQEGYLADDIFVDQRTQMNEKLLEGRYFCMIYQRTDIADQQKEIYVKDPDRIYMAVDGPKNSHGDDPVLPTTSINGWTITLVSKNCKHPDRAIAFMDYMMSEHGQKLISLGVEDEMYTKEDGKAVLRPEVKKLLNEDRSAYNAKYGADDAYWMLQNEVMQLDWMPKTEAPLAQMKEWTYPYTKYLGQYDVTLDADSDAGIANNNITKLWSETLPQLLLAESDEKFDAIMESYKKQRKALGYDLVMEEKNKLVQINKKKLGMD